MAQETTLQHSNLMGAESAVRRRLDDFLATLSPDELAELRTSRDSSDVKVAEQDVMIRNIVRESAAAIAIARVMEDTPKAAELVTGNLEKTTEYIFPELSDEQRVDLLATMSKPLGVPIEETERAVTDIMKTNAALQERVHGLNDSLQLEKTEVQEALGMLLAYDPNQLELFDQFFGHIPAFRQIISDAKVARLKAAREQETQEQMMERARAASAAVYASQPQPKDTIEEAVSQPSAPDSPPFGTRLGPVREFMTNLLRITGDLPAQSEGAKKAA